MHQGMHLQIKSLHLSLCIAWILPSDERDKLGRSINSKLVLLALMAVGTYFPRISECIHSASLLTLGCCIFCKAREMDKSGICATTGTIASQRLTCFICSSIKAQITHRNIRQRVHFVSACHYCLKCHWVLILNCLLFLIIWRAPENPAQTSSTFP